MDGIKFNFPFLLNIIYLTMYVYFNCVFLLIDTFMDWNLSLPPPVSDTDAPPISGPTLRTKIFFFTVV